MVLFDTDKHENKQTALFDGVNERGKSIDEVI